MLRYVVILSLIISTFSIANGQDNSIIYWSGGKARKFNIGCSFYGENILSLKEDSSFIMKRIGFQFKSEFKRRDNKMIDENTSIVEGKYSINGDQLVLIIKGEADPHWDLRVIRRKLITFPYKSLKIAKRQKDMIWRRTKTTNFKIE